jgi:hypothetical protein
MNTIISYWILSGLTAIGIAMWFASFAVQYLQFHRAAFIFMIITVTPWMTATLYLTQTM